MRLITNIGQAREELARYVRQADRVSFFTGAGISTECGIPDFRSPGSPWMDNKPVDFRDFVASRDMRAEAWRRKFAMDDIYQGSPPGRGHRAIASQIASGKAEYVITQNIDGLHQAAGVPQERVIELHGNGTYARCIHCGLRYELHAVRARVAAGDPAPDCDACGAPIKSATISFGQAMPQEEMERAQSAAIDCDIFLSIGSSLVVFPAASIPLIAQDAGAMLIILNREPTGLDEHADLVIRCDIGDVLSALDTQDSVTSSPETQNIG